MRKSIFPTDFRTLQASFASQLQAILFGLSRSFQNVLPLSFRNWVSHLLHQTFTEIMSITDRESYAAYVHESALDLCGVWSKKMKAEIGYGRSTKLLNLVLKRLPCLEAIDDTTRHKIIGFQHVPLDSYTIVGLRRLITDLEIPPNATMKFIQQPSEYTIFQQHLSGVAAEANVPAIYYDILAGIWRIRVLTKACSRRREKRAAADACRYAPQAQAPGKGRESAGDECWPQASHCPM